MRKDVNDISDTSLSLSLQAHSTAQPVDFKKMEKPRKSQLEITMEALLGELSEIKAENGIAEDRPCGETSLQ